MRINLKPEAASTKMPGWVNRLIEQFAAEHGTKCDLSFRNYVSTPQGSKALAQWARARGFKISHWCWEPYKQVDQWGANGKTVYPGFGLDVDESCPMVVEMKLKH